ncbi:MAG: hypothetical protein QW214_04085 [Saccharolobus sp.]
MEWLVIAMNCKVESPVPRYEYSGINGISENPNCFTIDLGNVVFQDEREEVRWVYKKMQ